MQNTLNYKDTLIKEACLLSLTKSDCDLFILAQVNTITYQQLAATGLHGISTTGGRLSLKKLTEQGYITGKTLPNTNRVKYFILTAKGKTRLEKIFSSTFLSTKQIYTFRISPAHPLKIYLFGNWRHAIRRHRKNCRHPDATDCLRQDTAITT